MVTIKLKGVERVQRKIVGLPRRVENEVDKTEGEFMSFVKKSAKLRAPRWTGELAKSIEKKQIKKGNWELTVDSPYGWFQEHGWKGHFVSSDASTRNSIGTVGQAFGIPSGVMFLMPASSGHPFVAPALEAGLMRLPSMLDTAAQKAIRGEK